MRQLDYAGIFWTLLSVKWGIFAVALIISVFYLWINLRFAAKNIDLVDGESFFNKAFRHPADAAGRSMSTLAQATGLLYRFRSCCSVTDFCAKRFRPMGYISSLQVWRFVWNCGPLFGVDLGFYVSAFHSMNYCREALQY